MEEGNGVIARGLAAAAAGDRERFLAMFSPDAELRPAIAGAVEGAEYRGREQLARWFDALGEAWEEYSPVTEGELAVGNHHFGLATMELRGRGSRVPIRQRVGIVATTRDGVFTRVRVSVDVAEALEEMAALVRGEKA